MIGMIGLKEFMTGLLFGLLQTAWQDHIWLRLDPVHVQYDLNMIWVDIILIPYDENVLCFLPKQDWIGANERYQKVLYNGHWEHWEPGDLSVTLGAWHRMKTRRRSGRAVPCLVVGRVQVQGTQKGYVSSKSTEIDRNRRNQQMAENRRKS